MCLVAALAACAPRVAPPVRLAGPPPHVVAGPLAGRTGASLTVRDAASRVQVVLATLPGLLYRISTPPASGLEPRASVRDGRIQATLRPTGADGPDEVRVVLNRDVRWDIRLPAGAGEQQLDLRRGRVTRLELGASGLVELRLPTAVGTVPVILTDDVGTVVLTTPPGTPVSLQQKNQTKHLGGYAVSAHKSIGALTVRTAEGPPA